MAALTDGRNVVINITGAARPIDAHNAVGSAVRKIEEQYALNPGSLTDLTTVQTVITGRQPYQVYVFNLTTVLASATYTYAYVETVPRIEDIT